MTRVVDAARATRARRGRGTRRRRARASVDEDAEDGCEDVVVPDAAPAATSREDRALLSALRSRQRSIALIKHHRARIAVGDYVSDEVTALRRARFAVEQRAFELRRDVSARLALERYDEAREIQRQVDAAEAERERLSLEIEREQAEAMRRLTDEI